MIRTSFPVVVTSRPILLIRIRLAQLAWWVLLPVVVLLVLTSPAYAASDDGSATVVVQVDGHDVMVREIVLDAPVNGFQALDLAGIEYSAAEFDFGRAVCSIEGAGCPVDDCFCGSGAWTYVYWKDGTWANHMTGPGDATVAVGDAEGWRWAPSFGEYPTALPRLNAATRGLAWLAEQQSAEDGGYGQSAAGAVETLLAIGANNIAPGEWQRSADAPSLAAFLHGTSTAYATNSAAAAGKLGVAMAAGDLCVPRGTLTPAAYYDTVNGRYAKGTGPAAWALLGTLALQESVPDAAIFHVRGLAQINGGWEWSPGWGTDTNSTALAIQALVAAGEAPTATVILNGVAYLATAQNEDGGFPYDPQSSFDTTSDTNSTAYVVQALTAAGEDVGSDKWTRNGSTPLDFLLSRQLPDGSFEWQSGTGANQLATQQAIPALMGEVYPLRVRAVAACGGVYLPLLQTASE